MNYNQVIKYLNNREKFGIKLGLKNIRLLLKKVGSPHKKIKCIHVAGTNGKGSCCAMISSVLQEAGYKVGMYTSPHLKRFNERIKINNKEISNKDVVKYFLKTKPHITTQTYFEVVTAIAFLYFNEKKVDFLVLEVGMGGRLDATNVVNPLVSLITTISLEHTEYLGNSLLKIAKEKAGIIKKNSIVVTGTNGNVFNLIKKIARKRKAKLVRAKKVKKLNGKFNINGYKKLELDLIGDFQLQNASNSIAVIEALRDYSIKIDKKKIKKGLKKARWQGRMQFLEKNVLVDCAHNPAGIDVLIKEVKKLNYKNLILVMGILKDKDIKEMVKKIAPTADKVIVTKPKTERAAEPSIIEKEFVKYNKHCEIIKDVRKALSHAKKNKGKNDLILVTGSIYTVGEVV